MDKTNKKDIVILSVPKIDPVSPIAGPAVLKSQVEKHGFSCKLYDFNHYLFKELSDDNELKQKWEFELASWFVYEPFIDEWGDDFIPIAKQFCLEVLIESDPDWIGISQFANYCFVPTQILIDIFREFGYEGKFVLGGPSCMEFNSESVLPKMVDHVIYGEGEEALVELLKGNTNYPGIDSKNFKQLVDLDSYPFPDYGDYDITEYANGGNILYIVGSRGCVRNCTFCDIHAMAPKFKFRSGKCLAEEVLHQYQKHPTVKFFRWADSLFNGAMKELHVFLDEIIKYKEQGLLPEYIGFNGQCIVRPIRQCPPWYFEKMARAHVISQDLGIESGSDRVREHMRKKFNNDDLDHYIKMSAEYGVPITALMMIGYPTETEEDFQDTLDLFTRHKERAHIFTKIIIGATYVLMPHSPMWDMQKELGITFDNRGNFILGDNTWMARQDRRERFIEHLLKEGYGHAITYDKHKYMVEGYEKLSDDYNLNIPSLHEFYGYKGDNKVFGFENK